MTGSRHRALDIMRHLDRCDAVVHALADLPAPVDEGLRCTLCQERMPELRPRRLEAPGRAAFERLLRSASWHRPECPWARAAQEIELQERPAE